VALGLGGAHAQDAFERGRAIEDPRERAVYFGKLIEAGKLRLALAHYYRGWARKEAGQYAEGAEDFKAALAIDEGYHWARDALAWTYYYNMAEHDLAAKHFEALIGNPDVPAKTRASACNGLAEIHRVKREFDKSIEIHEKGMKLEPTSLGYHNLAWLYNTHRKDFKKAIRLCRKSLELDPDYEYGRVSLAVFLANDGSKVEAAAIIEKVDQTKPVRHYNLACYYAVTGDRDRAMSLLDSYLANYHTVVKKRNVARDYMSKDWHLDSLKGDPRFRRLMRKESERAGGDGEEF